jgi:murein DD-endopeptidase MepM/ murein hydrolase activator NlpD
MLRRFLIATTLVFATTAYADAPFTSAVVTSADASLSTGFGQRVNEQGAAVFHAGADIQAAPGTDVYAPANGRIVRVHEPGALTGYHGQVVVLDHGDGVRIRLSGVEGAEAPGELRAGEVIGRIAARDDGVAPHVHIELWRNGNVVDPSAQMQLIAVAN